MPIVYDRTKDNIENITLTKGYYTFIYDLDEVPDKMTPQKLPYVTRVMGKSAVIRAVRVNKDNMTVSVDIWLAENPVWLLYLAYLAGGALIAWGFALTTGNLSQVVTETVNPTNLIIFLLIVLAFNLPKITRAFK